MTNAQSSANSSSRKRTYDLEERTMRFSQDIITFSKKISQDTISRPLINQLVRSGTSIGANYTEAQEASSKKDFVNKIAIATKETKETKYWLQLLAHTDSGCAPEARRLWKAGQELNLIFAAIIRSAKSNH